ncbi:hypothetical protein DIPPA_00033 [Diplonema papillatum]|nr:hypothetical protein DIPPA_00033 [Diplonema papillatum]
MTETKPGPRSRQMEVTLPLLVTGVLSNAQSKKKGGLSTKAIGQAIRKSFGKSLPPALLTHFDPLLQEALQSLVASGSILDETIGLRNVPSSYVLTEKAMPSIVAEKEHLETALATANEKRPRLAPKPKEKKGKSRAKQSVTTAAVDNGKAKRRRRRWPVNHSLQSLSRRQHRAGAPVRSALRLTVSASLCSARAPSPKVRQALML